MEKKTSIVAPLIVLALGIVMICLFNANVIPWIITAIGIVTIVLAVYNIICAIVRRSRHVPGAANDAAIITISLIALALGIWVVSAPLFFESVMVFVFAIALVAIAVNDVAFMVRYTAPQRLPFGFYVIPILMVAAAVILVCTPIRYINSTVVLVSGIAMTLAAVNRIIDVIAERR